ncbi:MULTISPECIES: hypothetical protein [unclassified Streptomyces]|uniref:hypothetical protein n=1 Tax=unclassified Streptomyces TaxID=2593676 RepID=UPI003664DEFE
MLPGEDHAAPRVPAVCVAAGVTAPLDRSALGIALPTPRRSQEVSPVDVRWIAPDHSLTSGTTPLPGGGPGDVHRREVPFLAGLSHVRSPGRTTVLVTRRHVDHARVTTTGCPAVS